MDTNTVIVVGRLVADVFKSKAHIDLLVSTRVDNRVDILPVRILTDTPAEYVDVVGLTVGTPVTVVGSLQRTWAPTGSRMRVIATDVKVG